MKYQVVYLDRYGNAERLAQEAARCLPPGSARMVDLSRREMTEGDDVYLIGFEADQKAIPYEIIDAMERMAGKSILLFLTAGIVNEESRGAIGRLVSPFLPDGCDFRGMFICQGRLPDAVLDAMEETVARRPASRQAQSLLTGYRQARSHPDTDDLRALRQFLCRHLNLGVCV